MTNDDVQRATKCFRNQITFIYYYDGWWQRLSRPHRPLPLWLGEKSEKKNHWRNCCQSIRRAAQLQHRNQLLYVWYIFFQLYFVENLLRRSRSCFVYSTSWTRSNESIPLKETEREREKRQVFRGSSVRWRWRSVRAENYIPILSTDFRWGSHQPTRAWDVGGHFCGICFYDVVIDAAFHIGCLATEHSVLLCNNDEYCFLQKQIISNIIYEMLPLP